MIGVCSNSASANLTESLTTVFSNIFLVKSLSLRYSLYSLLNLFVDLNLFNNIASIFKSNSDSSANSLNK